MVGKCVHGISEFGNGLLEVGQDGGEPVALLGGINGPERSWTMKDLTVVVLYLMSQIAMLKASNQVLWRVAGVFRKRLDMSEEEFNVMAERWYAEAQLEFADELNADAGKLDLDENQVFAFLSLNRKGSVRESH